MKKPLISVIIPIYNVEKYLIKCVNSVLNQTYSNLEIILVDDGSTDKSTTICDDFVMKDNRIVAYHKENGGLSDARNYGISHAHGEYITCIDSDDYVDLDYVEYLYQLIIVYQTKMSIAQHRVHFANGRIQENGSVGMDCLMSQKCIERMMYHDVIDTSAWGKLYHRSLFENVNYPKGKLYEDIGTTYALIMQCDYIAVGYESKYNYIVRKNSIVNGKFNLKKLELVEMTDKMANDVNEQYPELKPSVLRRQVYARISTLNQMLDVKECDHERNELLNFIRLHRCEVLKNRKTPFRDKIALVLLSISYPLYRRIWKTYLKCQKGV